MINKSCRLQDMNFNIKWTIRDVTMTDSIQWKEGPYCMVDVIRGIDADSR